MFGYCMNTTNTGFKNPLLDSGGASKTPESCIMVIFGATGDLTARKLLPALYNLAREGQLPTHFACVGFARRDKTHEDFRKEMKEAVSQFSRVKPLDEALWSQFANSLFYHRSEFHDPQGYDSLNTFLKDLDKKLGTKGNRIFYLSTPASFFPIIAENLGKQKLIYPSSEKEKSSRVIFEKPFGSDLNSAKALQTHIDQFMSEDQIFRIDHYLGKETVQNILIFRFSNSLFESFWNHHHIDNVQITVGEELGIGTRGKLWEESGMLRDIVQNHMMQLLTLVAMEPPVNLTADAIRDEKVKVLHSVRAFPKNQFDQYAVRGQYGPGLIDGNAVRGYREEDNVDRKSDVETYVALRLFIDNWRWNRVPFYLRAGKRLPKRATEIAITFKHAPGVLFQTIERPSVSNALVMRIQPNEGISIKMNCKVPGSQSPIQPVKMDFQYGQYFGTTPPEAYERLLCDCMAGDSTLFARSDEVLASWKILTPVLEHWKSKNEESKKEDNFPNYSAGSWGPRLSEELLEKDGRQWRLI